MRKFLPQLIASKTANLRWKRTSLTLQGGHCTNGRAGKGSAPQALTQDRRIGSIDDAGVFLGLGEVGEEVGVSP